MTVKAFGTKWIVLCTRAELVAMEEMALHAARSTDVTLVTERVAQTLWEKITEKLG